MNFTSVSLPINLSENIVRPSRIRVPPVCQPTNAMRSAQIRLHYPVLVDLFLEATRSSWATFSQLTLSYLRWLNVVVAVSSSRSVSVLDALSAWIFIASVLCKFWCQKFMYSTPLFWSNALHLHKYPINLSWHWFFCLHSRITNITLCLITREAVGASSFDLTSLQASKKRSNMIISY